MNQQGDRTVVRTYVPEAQHEVWAEEADSMDMSLSEFVRSMVQAGRRGFDLEGASGGSNATHEEPGSGGATPRGEALEDRVLDELDSGTVASWDELVAELSDDFEAQLESALDALMERGAIELDHRRGGYRRRGDE